MKDQTFPFRLNPLKAAVFAATVFTLSACGSTQQAEEAPSALPWLAGDHHIHSRFSVGWNKETTPPSPIIAGDAIYPTPMNALMGKRYGLSWMVTTDHGGPNHSKVNLEMAYPELLNSREAVPEVIQFYGMELNAPGADHSSLIIPHTHDEAQRLYSIESRFDKREEYPRNPANDVEEKMIEALSFMNALPTKPIVIANHPSRSAKALGEYGDDDPAELRLWNDTAPEIAVGMAAAPGHQAATLNPDGSANSNRPRGGYGSFPTMGGYDQMSARIGGFWDSMLGEGRHWWITANSDSHIHFTEGGKDFWPGEYSKTYVQAERSHDAVMAGIRAGRIFVTTGDLISELSVTVSSLESDADMGETLMVEHGDMLNVTLRLRDPGGLNHNGENPTVKRVDLIAGGITGPATNKSQGTNSTTAVIKRFDKSDWKRDGEYLTMSYTIEQVEQAMYLRVRGTNTDELEPELDGAGENPWSDLWFYSNPVGVKMDHGH